MRSTSARRTTFGFGRLLANAQPPLQPRAAAEVETVKRQKIQAEAASMVETERAHVTEAKALEMVTTSLVIDENGIAQVAMGVHRSQHHHH